MSSKPGVSIRFSDKTTIYSSRLTKRKMRSTLTNLSAQNAFLNGKCVVSYGDGYENVFDFNDLEELERKLWPCLDKELVDEFSGV